MRRRLPFLLALLLCWLLAGGAVVTAVGAFRFLRLAQPATGRVVALRTPAQMAPPIRPPSSSPTQRDGSMSLNLGYLRRRLPTKLATR